MPYLIQRETLALIPEDNKTKIIELEKTKYINENINKIITINCCLNGSTFEGRQKGSAYLLGTSYKPPIILNNDLNIILIPSHSHRNKDCTWLNLTSILHYYPNINNTVKIELINHQIITLNISYQMFDKQILRATRLESAIKGRIYQKYL